MQQTQQLIPELELWELALRLGVAAALTGAIGLERELRERAAGLRTHMLVGVGAALFTIVSAYGWSDFVFNRDQGTILDPTRIAAQIVTGIGFLGAGAIIRQGLSVRGLTTAAGLWVVAAIGMAAGAGYYTAALIGTGIVLVGLGPIRWLEGAPLIRDLRREGRALEVLLHPGESVGGVLDVLHDRTVRISRVEISDLEEGRQVRVEIDLPLGGAGSELVENLARREDVIAVRWGA
ncbi:MAG TPA: MgtC/SapB family protein [Gaiellaceae bacterium]|nr:MgtC/SapB family protein [Gaiellaceae bacterium]HSJ94480.1 MgtC/SapB family protein [Gaiellaceae bacterium]